MELKNYQKDVIADLNRYIELLNETGSLSEAFAEFWQERQIEVGKNGMLAYQDIIPGVPNVCYKVPTGGGKTLLACASVKPIFDGMHPMKHRALVWLVPSDAILRQTLSALRNPDHPYRQYLNKEFSARVEVYSKEELLAGQNFNPTTVSDQLSVMVLSYDSFRTSKAEGRKAYQANSALVSFTSYLGAPERPIEDADDSALFQVINQLNPVVVVDESHHARSKLSLEMLKNFNPSFVLDLTATPRKDANIISYVDAIKLKNENMVKLPVIVYNRNNQAEVISDAIDLRASVERLAQEEHDTGGEYIRPIVLFQAEPKGKEDATSFEKLREKLVGLNIPAEQIAIKTANIDELKNVDLLSPECPIRYIITVNALKEGWDCPFAYILASLANKSSRVDVEQILGRILRQPYARKHKKDLLNMSYVLTSSANFQQTVDDVVKALNAAGFTARDHRVVDEEGTIPGVAAAVESAQSAIVLPEPAPAPNSSSEVEVASEEGTQEAEEEYLNFDPKAVVARSEYVASTSAPRTVDVHMGPAVPVVLEQTTATGGHDTAKPQQNNEPAPVAPVAQEPVQQAPSRAAVMMEQAAGAGTDYEEKVREETAKPVAQAVPQELEDKMSHYRMNPVFEADAASLKIPQFFIRDEDNLFSEDSEDNSWVLLTKEGLTEGFSLQGKDSKIDVSRANEDMIKVDVRKGNADRPKAFGMDIMQQNALRGYLDALPEKSRIEQCTGIVISHLDRLDSVAAKDIKNYVRAVVASLQKDQLKTLENSPHLVAQRIKEKIVRFLDEYRADRFTREVDLGSIVARGSYTLPETISPTHAVDSLGKSLYEGEGNMNTLERKVLTQMIATESVEWWHRNPERTGFYINGAINHYPDFIVRTISGKILLVETKGAMLKNDDSKIKLELGKTWAIEAGKSYRYYMVFEDNVTPIDGAHTISDFISLLQDL